MVGPAGRGVRVGSNAGGPLTGNPHGRASLNPPIYSPDADDMKPLDFLAQLFQVGALILLSLQLNAQSEDQPVNPDQERAPAAFLMRIEGPLDRSTQSHLTRAIDLAAENDSTLIIELETPGGEVTLMWQMARAIESAGEERGIKTVAYVNENALSAGALIAMGLRAPLHATQWKHWLCPSGARWPHGHDASGSGSLGGGEGSVEAS